MDDLAKGECPGTTDEMEEDRLRFGILSGGDEGRDGLRQRGDGAERNHAAFGLEA